MTMDSSNSSLGFLDLPAELRNRIYKLALHIEPGSITLFMHYNGAYSHFKLYKAPSVSKNDNLWKPTLPLAPNLLATCKQIRSEALPVLYGNAVIEVPMAAVWAMFQYMKQMNMTPYFIRHLDLFERVPYTGTWSDVYLEDFRLLEDLPYLQSLHYRPDIKSAEASSRSDEHIADRIFPLVKRMKENCSKIGESSSLPDILKLTVYCTESISFADQKFNLRVQALLEEKLRA